MRLKLITETSYDFTVKESKSDGTYLVGIFSSSEIENNNKRKYPKPLLEREIKNITENKVSKKSCFGELGHPPQSEINLDKVAILTTQLEWKGNDVYGKAKVLDTPMGSITKTLLKEGKLGISSRGLGTVNEEGYVNEDFHLLTWDVVADPSNPGSWVNGIFEGKEFEVPGVNSGPTLEDAKKYYEKQIWQVIEKIERGM